MATITEYGLKEYSNKHNSDIVNILIDIGLLTPSKVRSGRKLEYYDRNHRLWFTRQKTSKENFTYKAYKTMSNIKEPTEEKSVLLLDVLVTPDRFEVKDFTKGDWIIALKELVHIQNI